MTSVALSPTTRHHENANPGARVWTPVFCRGKRKDGATCLNIIGYKGPVFVPGSFATLCRRCRFENVVD
mgnify:CR=1 FL=1